MANEKIETPLEALKRFEARKAARKAIIRKNGMRLVYAKTGEPVCTGDGVTTWRGDAYIVTGGAPPRHEGSTGRIYVRIAGEDGEREFFPSVFECKWVEDRTS